MQDGTPGADGRTRMVLSIVVTGSFLAALAALYYLPVPPTNKDLVVFMLGHLTCSLGAVMAFSFGTTKANVTKDSTIAGMADQLGQSVPVAAIPLVAPGADPNATAIPAQE